MRGLEGELGRLGTEPEHRGAAEVNETWLVGVEGDRMRGRPGCSGDPLQYKRS